MSFHLSLFTQLVDICKHSVTHLTTCHQIVALECCLRLGAFCLPHVSGWVKHLIVSLFSVFDRNTYSGHCGQKPSSLFKEGKCWSAVGNTLVLLLHISKKVRTYSSAQGAVYLEGVKTSSSLRKEKDSVALTGCFEQCS